MRSKSTVTVPLALSAKCCTSCAVMLEPSEPANLTVSVNVLFVFFSFRLKFPQTVKCPVKLTPLASVADTLPVSVNVAQTSVIWRSSLKNVSCSTTVPTAEKFVIAAPVQGFMSKFGSANAPRGGVDRDGNIVEFRGHNGPSSG